MYTFCSARITSPISTWRSVWCKGFNMKKPFEGLWGNSCELRTLELLLPLRGIEFNITELAEEVDVSRQTTSKILKKFDEWGVVKSRIDKALMYYSINEESPLIEAWEHLNNVMIEHMLGEEELYAIHDFLECKRSQPTLIAHETADAGSFILSHDQTRGLQRIDMIPSTASSLSEGKSGIFGQSYILKNVAQEKKSISQTDEIKSPRGIPNAA